MSDRAACLSADLLLRLPIRASNEGYPKVREDFAILEEAPIRRIQLGEGPSRGLLRDYEPSDGPSFQSLVSRGH